MLRGWDAKADEYLFKPFHPNELVTRVKSLLSVTNDRKKAAELVNKKDSELKGAYAEVESLSYSATHDLLGPLHNISGYAQMMLKDYGVKLDDEGRKNLEQIHKLTLRMSELITNIFRFVRASHMELVQNTADMTRLIEDVIDEIKQQEKNFRVQIKVNELPPCNCDLHLMQQVWCNLIGNAIKYTSHKDDPEVEIGSMEKDGQIVYYIKDNGAGFDMRYAHKLFLPFERLHHDTEFTGSGMGLALAHRIIERHGGKIWAEAKEGKGATFYFTMGASEQPQDKKNETPRK
jgi:light-regulated signal transduction histidine kinase (bacteriophytochrome)